MCFHLSPDIFERLHLLQASQVSMEAWLHKAAWNPGFAACKRENQCFGWSVNH